MNAKKEYEKMLEITGSSCNITVKPLKRKRRAKKPSATDLETVKDELIEKVNERAEETAEQIPETNVKNFSETAATESDATDSETMSEIKDESQEKTENATVNINKKPKRKFKLGFIGAELAVIGVLLSVIFLSSAVLPTSGLNTFFKGVFGGESEQKDTRVYGDFNPVLPFSDGDKIAVDGGVMTYSEKGSVYSPCDGRVTAVYKDNGKYVVEVSHSENFKTVFSGVDYVYSETGDRVYCNIPLGYVLSGGKACFYSDNAVITGYTLKDGSVVWAV